MQSWEAFTILPGLEEHPGQGPVLKVNAPPPRVTCGLPCLPLGKGYPGRVNLGFRFTFILKVEDSFSIGDDGLEKPISHHLTSS